MPIVNKRTVDDQTRLPLPLPMRQQLHLNFKDSVVWSREGDKVVIRSAGKAVALTGQITSRIDDMGKVQVPRTMQQLGLVAGVEVELTCDNDAITMPVPL